MEDDKLSIKINIANRYYPLKIARADEERIREAAKRINQSVERYRTLFAGRDMQDALSMSSLQFVIKLSDLEQDREGERLRQELSDLDQLLGDYLDKADK